MGTGEVLVEGKLVRKPFFIELATLCAVIFVYAYFITHPLFPLDALPGLSEGLEYALGIMFLVYVLLKLRKDMESNAPCKWTRFFLRLVVIYGLGGLVAHAASMI